MYPAPVQTLIFPLITSHPKVKIFTRKGDTTWQSILMQIAELKCAKKSDTGCLEVIKVGEAFDNEVLQWPRYDPIFWDGVL
jgi:hypothetical protein